MADSFSVEMNLNAVKQAFEGYMGGIQERIASSLQAVAEECAADIASRAPTPEQEFIQIMGHSRIGLSGDASADSDSRTRFMRSGGKWMRDAVLTSVRIDPETFTIDLGNPADLIAATTFTYVNYSRKNGRVPHITNLGGQLFNLFEYGGVYVVHPTYAPKLAPDEKRSSRTSSFAKYFTGHRMYSGFDPAIFYNALVKLTGLE